MLSKSVHNIKLVLMTGSCTTKSRMHVPDTLAQMETILATNYTSISLLCVVWTHHYLWSAVRHADATG